jgi:ribonuclease T2
MRICVIAATLAFSLSLPAPGQQSGSQPGVFDYYLLTLSWSPEFCHSHSNDAECLGSKHYGFVVHGLWPEFSNGGYPEYCSKAPGLSDPTKMLDIMPDQSLIDHEWLAHGTCSGLGPEKYFDLVRQAFSSVSIPPDFRAPDRQLTVAPEMLKTAFARANPGLARNDLQVTCRSYYLNSIEICLTKNLAPTACPAPRECRANTIRVAPIR